MAKAKAAPKRASATATDATMVVIERPAKQNVSVRIVGKTRLVVNRFPEKARHMIAGKQAGEKVARTKRVPKEEYLGSMYLLPSKKGKGPRYGFPAGGIKKAITAAGYRVCDIPMTQSNGWFFIQGEPCIEDGFSSVDCVEIIGTPQMRTDVVHIGQGKSDLRYRAEFVDWKMDLLIDFQPDRISLKSLVNLIDHAGDGVGIGEWRVEKKGDWGRFQVAVAKG